MLWFVDWQWTSPWFHPGPVVTQVTEAQGALEAQLGRCPGHSHWIKLLSGHAKFSPLQKKTAMS